LQPLLSGFAGRLQSCCASHLLFVRGIWACSLRFVFAANAHSIRLFCVMQTSRARALVSDVSSRSFPAPGRCWSCLLDGYWHDSQLGSSTAQNFAGAGSCAVSAGFFGILIAEAPVDAFLPLAMPIESPEEDTALSSPPWPVDFSADVAASVRS